MKITQVLLMTVSSMGLIACSGGGKSDSPPSIPVVHPPAKPLNNSTTNKTTPPVASSNSNANNGNSASSSKPSSSNSSSSSSSSSNSVTNNRLAPDSFKYYGGAVTPTDAGVNAPLVFFSPVIEKEGGYTKVLAMDGKGLVYKQLDNLEYDEKNHFMVYHDGKYVKEKLSSYSIYSNHLNNSAIAMINAQGYLGFSSYRIGTTYLYGGQATNANELETLKGSAQYVGTSFIDRKIGNAQVNVNFDNKTVSGYLNSGNMVINLENGKLSTQDGYLSFSGQSSDSWGGKGEFSGKLMGSNAKEIAGQSTTSPKYSRQIHAVFNGTKK